MKRHLSIVLSHPTQYYSPWFRHLASESGLRDWELRVFYLWDFGVTQQTDRQFARTLRWDTDLLSGYASEFVPNRAKDPGTHHFGGLDNPTLGRRLRTYAPEAVLVFGYAYKSQLKLLLRPPAPLLFRGDSHLIDHPRPSLFKRLGLRWVYSRFAVVTCVGKANRDYFRTFGVPEQKLHFVPHCVDAIHFQRTPAVETAAHTRKVALGLEHSRVVLFAGKLIPAKQPRELLQAFLSLNPPETALVIVGDGSESDALRALAANHPNARVRFLPFTNQSEMPAVYAMADLFVLPSRGLYETWGLAVNEAMHLGVPCLVSNRVGCQRDLVIPGVTGWVFHCDDQADFVHTLRLALNDLQKDAPGWRQRVLRHISGYTYAAATEGLQRTLESTLR